MSASVSHAPISTSAEGHPPTKAFTSLFPRTKLSKRDSMDMHHSSTQRSNRNESLSTVSTFVQSNRTRKSRRAATTFSSHNTIQATGEKSTRVPRVRAVMWRRGSRVVGAIKTEYVARARPSSAEYVEQANERRALTATVGVTSRPPHPAPHSAGPRAQPWHRKSSHWRQNVARR